MSASKRFLKNNLVQINENVYEFGQIRKSFFGTGKCSDCGYKDNRFNSYKLIDHLSSKHSDIYDIKLLTPDHDVNIHTGQLISCPQVQHNGAKSRTIDENPKTLKEPRAAKKSVINFGSSLTDKQHSTNRLSSNGELRGEHPSAKYGHFSSVNNVSCNEVSSSTHQSTHQSAHQSIEQPTHQSVHQQTQRSPPKHSSKSQAFSSLDDIIDRIRRDRKRINQKEEDDDDIEIVLVTPYKGLSSH